MKFLTNPKFTNIFSRVILISIFLICLINLSQIMAQIDLYKSFKTSIPWILLVLGVLGFTFTEFYTFFTTQETLDVTFNKNWLSWAGGLSKAILISGISSVLLNSIEYMGIFRGAMEDIVMGQAYLANRKDIAVHWEKVTLLLFKNRFPDIHNQITTM